MNYTTLTQRIQDWTENDATEFVNVLDTIIEFAEAKVYREADFPVARKSANLTIVANTSTVTQPSDILYARWIKLASGNFLLPKDESFILEFSRLVTAGTPKFYAIKGDATNFILGPTPSANTTAEISYIYRPEQISSTNATTWLSNNYSDLLLYACLLESYAFMKGEGQDIQLWTEQYRRALEAARSEQMGRRNTDRNRGREPKG